MRRNTDVQFTERILTSRVRASSHSLYKYPEVKVTTLRLALSTLIHSSFPSTAMAHIRRASVSSTHRNRSASPLVFVAASNADTDEWVKAWKQVTVQGTDNASRTARLCIWIGSDAIPLDLVESPVVAVNADESVEVACDVRRLCG